MSAARPEARAAPDADDSAAGDDGDGVDDHDSGRYSIMIQETAVERLWCPSYRLIEYDGESFQGLQPALLLIFLKTPSAKLTLTLPILKTQDQPLKTQSQNSVSVILVSDLEEPQMSINNPIRLYVLTLVQWNYTTVTRNAEEPALL